MRANRFSVLLIVVAFLTLSEGVSMGQEGHKLARLGRQMTADEKAALEEHVSINPNDVEARTKLLGYYFSSGRLRDPEAQSARRRHIVWLIENSPESEVLGQPYGQLIREIESEGYGQAMEAWKKAIQDSPENLSVLGNAANYFLLSNRELSAELLLKAQAIAPDDPRWSLLLGRNYSLGLVSLPEGAARKATAKRAFQQFERAYGQSDSLGRAAILSDVAKSAFEAELFDEAKKYAEEMLKDGAEDWNLGNNVHHGNLILGRIALSNGNVDEAKSRLLLAGKTPGSPQLISFGPNMQLAKELLERGEQEVVLEYFELCKGFWKSANGKLDQWAEDVKASRTPQFRGNLLY